MTEKPEPLYITPPNINGFGASYPCQHCTKKCTQQCGYMQELIQIYGFEEMRWFLTDVKKE